MPATIPNTIISIVINYTVLIGFFSGLNLINSIMVIILANAIKRHYVIGVSTMLAIISENTKALPTKSIKQLCLNFVSVL